MKKDNSTKLIRSGLKRTQFMETSEPLFLTSGFVYNSAEEAEDAFKERKKKFMYSRFGNPTVKMLQDKLSFLTNDQYYNISISNIYLDYNNFILDQKKIKENVQERSINRRWY